MVEQEGGFDWDAYERAKEIEKNPKARYKNEEIWGGNSTTEIPGELNTNIPPGATQDEIEKSFKSKHWETVRQFAKENKFIGVGKKSIYAFVTASALLGAVYTQIRIINYLSKDKKPNE